MATIIAASTDTHFLLNGTKYPVSYKVYPEGSLDARLEDVDGSGSIVVLAGATVGGSVRATQDALIDALAALVTPGGAAGGAQPVTLSPAAGTTVVLANAAISTGAQTAVDMPKAFVDFTFILTGTGAISATCVIEKSDGTNWFPAATMVLSGTTSVKDSDWFESVMGQIRANITAISGTGAALTVRAGY